MTTTEYFTTNNAAIAGVAAIRREDSKKDAFDPEKDQFLVLELKTPYQLRPHITCEEDYGAPIIKEEDESEGFFVFNFGKEYESKDFREFISNEGVIVFQNEHGVQLVTKNKKTAQKIKNFVQRGKKFRIKCGGHSITVELR